MGFTPGELAQVGDEYDLKESEGSSHSVILELMDDYPPSKVLDVGCSGGLLGRAAPRPRATTSPASTASRSPGVEKRVDEFVAGRPRAGAPRRGRQPASTSRVAADVLEHLRNSDQLLREMGSRLGRGRPGHHLGAELRPLVPAGAHDAGHLRLRPARHPRQDPRPVLHPPQPAADDQEERLHGEAPGDDRAPGRRGLRQALPGPAAGPRRRRAARPAAADAVRLPVRGRGRAGPAAAFRRVGAQEVAERVGTDGGPTRPAGVEPEPGSQLPLGRVPRRRTRRLRPPDRCCRGTSSCSGTTSSSWARPATPDLSWGYLTDPLFRHFSPVVPAGRTSRSSGRSPSTSWVVPARPVRAARPAWPRAVTWLMVVLHGRTRLALVGSLAAGARRSPSLPLGNWWTAGVNILPALVGFYVAFGAMVQILRGRSRVWALGRASPGATVGGARLRAAACCCRLPAACGSSLFGRRVTRRAVAGHAAPYAGGSGSV